MRLSNFVSSDMSNYLSIIAFVIVIILKIGNIILTYFTHKKEKLFHVITTKRSERMDNIREYSSVIMAICDIGYLKQNFSDDKKLELIDIIIRNINSLKVLLQRAYIKDRELIDLSYEIKNTFIKYLNNKEDDLLLEIEDYTNQFYKKIDLYIGAEWERLKYEADGSYAKYGDVKNEEELWNLVYKSLEETSIYKEENFPQQ